MNVTRVLAASTLAFEAFAVFFGGLVAMNLTDLSTGTALGVFSALALACLLTAGVLRFSWGYWLGSALQVLVVASGLLVGAMYIVGGVFAVLWVLALVLGTRAMRKVAHDGPR